MGYPMSIKSLLMPIVSSRLLSRDRLLKARVKAERLRHSQGEPHRLHYFHQVDDPYSAILASRLGELLKRYDIVLSAHVVGPPQDSAAPDRERLVAYSRKDAQRLAHRHGLSFTDPGEQPDREAQERVTRILVAAAEQGCFLEAAEALSAALWQKTAGHAMPRQAEAAWPEASPSQTVAHLTAANTLRQRLGHYLGATLYYAGEWYWGIDRMHHLEQRLQDVGAHRPGVSGYLFPLDTDLTEPVVLAHPSPIDFFFSLRSPYSAIVAERVFKLGSLTGAPVHLRYVLPMVMRGLPVPSEKRRYISLDAAREAHLRGAAYGRINDPVGRPVERGLALMPLAERSGQGQAYVLSFMRGVWAEGIDAGSDRGLRLIAERADLSWKDVQNALQDETWRQIAEANRTEMLGLGLWGVPSFRVADTAVWGQDRLWAIQQAVLQNTSLSHQDSTS